MKTSDYLLIAVIGLGAYLLLTRKKETPMVVGSPEWIASMAATVTSGGDPKAGTGYYLLRPEYQK